MIRTLAVAMVFVSNEGFAFELTKTSTGADLRWDPPSFAYGATFTLGDPEGEQFARSCRYAVDQWMNRSLLGFDARWEGPHAQPVENDGANTVGIVSEWNAVYGEAARTVAHTEVRHRVDTGQILEADIFLNGESFSFEDEDGFDAESVVLHEMGHLIGIAHSCGDPGRTYPSCFSVPEEERMRVLDAVMAPTLAPGVHRDVLSADDVEAAAVHYPATATGSHPQVLGIERNCTTNEPAIAGGDEEASMLRFSSGEVRSFGEWEGTADVIVRDRIGGPFTAVYLAEPPPPCGDLDEGCGCRAHRQAGGNGAILFVGLAVAMLAARRRWMLLSIAVALFAANDAFAFKCSRVGTGFGPSLIWQTRTIPWYADEALFDVYGDRPLAEEDARASFQAWEDVPCSDVTFPLAAIIPNLRAEYLDTGDNKNVVVAMTSGWPYDRAALAVTTSAYDVRTGVVVDADIEINAEHFIFQRVQDACVPDDGTMDLRNTITHEVGHIVGLDHPPNTPSYEEVTMFASAPPCEVKKRTLETDDIDGICSIYPAGDPSQQCYPPDGPSFVQTDSDDGFGGCSAAGGGAGAWGLIALLLLAARRLRRAW